jgi:hypothetical protein
LSVHSFSRLLNLALFPISTWHNSLSPPACRSCQGTKTRPLCTIAFSGVPNGWWTIGLKHLRVNGVLIGHLEFRRPSWQRNVVEATELTCGCNWKSHFQRFVSPKGASFQAFKVVTTWIGGHEAQPTEHGFEDQLGIELVSTGRADEEFGMQIPSSEPN